MLEFRNFEEYFSNDLIITNKRFAIFFFVFLIWNFFGIYSRLVKVGRRKTMDKNEAERFRKISIASRIFLPARLLESIKI